MRVPVTPAQHALLFIQELVPRVDLYNIGWRIVFDNPIDVDAIRSSLDRLIQAQPTFRTQFDSSTGVPVAEVVPVTAAPLEIIRVDATGVDWADTVEREGQSLVRQPIPLDRAPLCRFRLLIAPDAAALLCSAHHIISDGVSLRVFLDELVAGYHGGPGTQVDVAERERWLHGELTAQCRAARTAIDDGTLDRLASTLHGVAPTVLAPSPERPERTRFRGHQVSTVMPVPQWMELSQTAKTLGTTPFCVLLACFAILLGEHSGNPEVIVGAPFSTRRTIASHDLCGFFVNTLPIVLPATLRDFRVHCAEVSAGVRTAQRCQSVPFDTLVARTVRKRTDNRNPIFQCVFAMQDVMANTRQLAPGNVIRLEWPHSGAAKFDLLLAAKPVNDGLILQLEWDADLLTDSFATDFFTEYQQLLHRVTTGSSGMAEAAT